MLTMRLLNRRFPVRLLVTYIIEGKLASDAWVVRAPAVPELLTNAILLTAAIWVT